MKKVIGTCWKYQNSPELGITWAAELKGDNIVLTVHGQKKCNSAISLANKYAKKLNFKLSRPWEKDNDDAIVSD